MKHLFLIRHAKSDWKTGAVDFERPLNKRGKKAAPFMGQKLKEKVITPDMIISSPANRAITTARLIANETGYPLDSIKEEQAIYHASSIALLNVVNSLPDDKDNVFLFGHNPGITQFAEYLTGENIGNMPTASIVGVSFMLDNWRTVSKETGMLLFFDYPKQYPEMQ